MIEHLAYLGALMAPEIASAAADAAGSLVEQTGRRLAAGMADEIGQRLSAASGGGLAAFAGLLQREAGGVTEAAQAAAAQQFAQALGALSVSVVSTEELGLLREAVAAAATGGNVAAAVDKLRAFHERQAGGAPGAAAI